MREIFSGEGFPDGFLVAAVTDCLGDGEDDGLVVGVLEVEEERGGGPVVAERFVVGDARPIAASPGVGRVED